MKRRFFALLLTLALAVGLLPVTATAEEETAAIDSNNKTVTIDGTAYKMSLGQGTQNQDGTLQYWLDKVDRGFITEGTNEFRYYLFLRDSGGTEATKEVYTTFWSECEVTSSVYQINNDCAPVSIVDYGDEYHKYFPVSVTGAQSGTLSITIKDSADSSCTLSQTFQYTQATELTSDNGTYTISISDAVAKQSYFYYIDLGTSKKVSVSGALTDVSTGRLALAQKAEGEGEASLWQCFSEGNSANTATQTVTTDKLLLRVVSNAGGTVSGVVTVEEVTSGGGNQSGGENEGGNQGNSFVVPELPAATSDFYDSQTRDLNDSLSHVYRRCLQEGSGDYRAIYYVTENGFTAEEKATVTVSAEAAITPSDDIISYSWLEREDGKYDLKILLSQLDYNNPPAVMYGLPYNVIVKKGEKPISAIRVDTKLEGRNQTVDGVMISFAHISESGAVEIDTDILGGQGNHKYNGDYEYRTNATLVAATGNYTDGWTLDETVTSSLKITSLKIVNINGDPETFSWSPESYVSTLSDVSSQSIPLYVKAGKVAQSMVEATVTGKINGESFETTVTGGLWVYFLNGASVQRPENDTVEALNEFLETLADSVDPNAVSGNIYKVYLADTTYTGTIVLPEEFQDWNILHLYGASGAGKKTIVQGGIDLNTARVENLEDIHFVAAEGGSELTRALYGSAVRTMSNCSFYGYDVAADSSAGVINAKGGNVFVNNDIAILIDLKEVSPGHNLTADEWFDNTFINNSIAVKILSLNKTIRQFYFRITNSNFINNGTDFYASCGGTLYMYNNYYGQYKLVDNSRPTPGKYHADRNNGQAHLHLEDLLNATTLTAIAGILDIGEEDAGRFVSAKVTASDDTTVITNSRWKYPVKRWWGHKNVLIEGIFFPGADRSSDGGISAQAEETEYVNIPVIDPKQKTRIINDESADLLIDGSVFDAADANNDAIQMEVVELVDSAEVTVGTWNFD